MRHAARIKDIPAAQCGGGRLARFPRYTVGRSDGVIGAAEYCCRGSNGTCSARSPVGAAECAAAHVQ